MRFLKTVSLNEAVTLLKEQAPLEPGTEKVSLFQALGRYVAEDIVSGETVPYYDRSTVDGYAVVSNATQGASDSVPVVLKSRGKVEIGTLTGEVLGPDVTMYVPTGGMVPEGADAMVMIEDTEVLDDLILIQKPAAAGTNLIRTGEDVRPGEKVLSKGKRLTPQDIGVLAQLNLREVPVVKKPRAFIISTGDEFAPFTEELGDGRIRDINTFTLAAMAEKTGFEIAGTDLVRDDLELIRSAIEKGLAKADIVMLSGGSSAGEKDFSRKAMEALGGEILFHGIRIKPGKPTIGAVIQGKPVIGLPGHPVSAMTVFQTLVVDLYRQCAGVQIEERRIRARTAVNFPSQPGRLTCQFLTLTETEEGVLCQPYPSSSSLISQLTNAQGYVMIPEETEGLDKGTLVDVVLF